MKPKPPKTCHDLASDHFSSLSLHIPHVTLYPATVGCLQLLHTFSRSHCFAEPCPLSHTPPSASLSFSLSQVCNVFLNLLAQVTAPLPFLFFKTQLSSYFLQKPSLTALVSEWCPYVYLVLRPLYSKLPAYTNLSV